MKLHSPLMLASFDLSRAPLLMVLGLALVVFTWHMVSRSQGGGRRIMMTGALLLGIGYVILLPLQESGLLTAGHEGHGHDSVLDTAAWRVVKPVVMNLGWLLLGGGLALHVRSRRAAAAKSNSPTHHESIA